MKLRALRVGLVAAVAATGLAVVGGSPAPASAATWSLQDQNTPGVDAMRLAQEIAGPGVTVNAATFTGDLRQGGLFSGPGVVDAVGVTDGVVLSSGNIAGVKGPNDDSGHTTSFAGAGDANLDTLVAPNDTNDAAVLNITFTPTSTDLQINYVFASEEYKEYVDSSFNDVFAFFVNGNNCATVDSASGPQPVSINTINHLRNTQIYVDNPVATPTYDTQFDGFTQVLTCFATVNPGVPNTLKLAVADTSDFILDTAVFLESSGVTSTPKTKYTPFANPVRAYDSRTIGARLPAGGTVTIPMAGLNGVPADAVSVALNVTSAQAAADGFLTVYPANLPQPATSSVNYRTGADDPNFVIATLGDGAIKIFSDKSTDVVVDIFGFFSTSAVNGFIPVTPARATDTRSGPKPAKGSTHTFQVGGLYGVPAGVQSVVLNLTLDGPDAAGWAAVFASGASTPATSNVNVKAGETRPNLVFAPVGADGRVSVYLDTSSHVIADVLGYFSTASDAELFKPVKPKRLIDTRPSGVRVHAGETRTIKVTDIGGVPSTATAVVLNVTATDTQGYGYFTVFPANVGQPNSSNVNYIAGQSIPNVVVSGVSADGSIKIYSFGEAHLIVDVAGWFG